MHSVARVGLAIPAKQKPPFGGETSHAPRPLSGEGEGHGGVAVDEGIDLGLGLAEVGGSRLILGTGLGVSTRAKGHGHLGDASHADLAARGEEGNLGLVTHLAEGREGEGLGGLDLPDEGLRLEHAHEGDVAGEGLAGLSHGGEVEGEGGGGGGDDVVHKQDG